MQEDPVTQTEPTADDLQSDQVASGPKPEDKPPEDKPPEMSWATYYGLKADEAHRRFCIARQRRRHAQKRLRNARERLRNIEERRNAEESLRRMVAWRQRLGHSNADIAEDLGCTLAELVERYPQQP
jgi:hypothetical protein